MQLEKKLFNSFSDSCQLFIEWKVIESKRSKVIGISASGTKARASIPV